MRKKLWLALLCAILLLGVFSATALAETVDSGTCGENLTWTLDDQGVLTISGTGEMMDKPNFGDDKNAVTSAVIEEGITSIGRNAFWDFKSLTSVTIPESITKIGYSAFSGCDNLERVNITSYEAWKQLELGEYYNGQNPLYNAKAQLYVNGELYKYHAEGTCGDNLTWVLDGNTLTISGTGDMVDEPGFSQYRYAINSVIIEEGVTSIGSYAFIQFASMANITIPESVTCIGNEAFVGCKSLTDITIPEGVTVIGEGAFSSCSSLKSIALPESLTQIGVNAFSDCDNLEKVYIKNLEAWKNLSFGDYYEWKNPLYNPKAQLYVNGNLHQPYVEGGYHDDLTWVLDGNTLTISGSGDIPGSSSFGGYRYAITSVIIEKGVTGIGAYAFNGCTSLNSITIPEGVTIIEDSAFEGCFSLKSITLPESLTVIGNRTFNSCKSLKTITIPQSVTSIGDWSFGNCASLDNIVIPGNVTSIGQYAFCSCHSLKTITLPEGLTHIPEGMFNDCLALTHITLPESITSIDNYAFNLCTTLENITIPKNVTSIGDWAFSTTILKSITIPEGVTSIGDRTFNGCAFMTSVTLPKSLRSIADAAFQGCAALESITIPQNVTTLGDSVFRWCSQLKEITFTGNAPTSFHDNAFSTLTVTARYPVDKATWTEDVMQNYGGDQVTWVGYGEKLATPAVKAANDAAGVKVTWNKIAGATSYKVYRKTSTSGWFAIKSGLTGLTYTDTTAKSGITYYYTVRAINDSQQSSFKSSSAIKHLAQPTVTLSNTSTGMKISWGKVTGAAKYVVYRCTNGKSWKSVATVTGTTYTDTTAKSGTTYYYTVRAVNGSTYSSYITTQKLVRLAQPEVKLANAATGVKISWGKVTGAESYKVYRKTTGGWVAIKSGITNLSFTDTTAKSGTTYYYTVRAVKGSSYSSYVSTKKLTYLAQPAITLSNASTGVKVSWGKVTGASSYKVYRKTTGGSWTAIKSGLTALSFTDTTAKSGTTYYYTVRAVKGASLSSYITTQKIIRLSQPTVKTAAVTGGVKVTWGKVTGAASYKVYRKTSGGSWAAIKSGLTGTSYTDKSAVKGRTYYYTVRAVKGTQQSSFKSSIAVKRTK